MGTDVIIDITPIATPSSFISCLFYMNGSMLPGNIPVICNTVPPNKCEPNGRYENRTRYTNSTTLMITNVRKDENGIYQCYILGTLENQVLISGVIIVG